MGPASRWDLFPVFGCGGNILVNTMPEPDQLLIAEFNARRSEDAFAALVQQHVNFVFAAAWRQVGDHGPAAVVKAYFQAMTNYDWAEMGKFTPESDVTKTKRELEEGKKDNIPLPKFEVGEAAWSAEHSAYFVKCIQGGIKKFKMGIRNDNAARHWIVDGGI